MIDSRSRKRLARPTLKSVNYHLCHVLCPPVLFIRHRTVHLSRSCTPWTSSSVTRPFAAAIDKGEYKQSWSSRRIKAYQAVTVSLLHQMHANMTSPTSPAFEHDSVYLLFLELDGQHRAGVFHHYRNNIGRLAHTCTLE